MTLRTSLSRRGMLLVLHPVFALTGIADAIIGPILPSLARTYQLSDSQSGLLFFWIFTGMATGALLCRGDYARILASGLFAMTVGCCCFPWVPRPALYPFVFFFGISIGAPMTATSLFAGRNFPAHRASTLTMLNFTWSAGAMLAPLLAARLLAVSSWHTIYFSLAGVSGLAFLVVAFTIRDSSETARTAPETTGGRNLRLVALFALFFFLEVGMETMFGAWIPTFVLRSARTTMVLAAAAGSIYWTGFLLSRALSPLLLLRVRSGRFLQYALPSALAASLFLVASGLPVLTCTAVLLLGAALAPIFPVALAAFFDRARHSSDSRFVLALSGFGGSVFPWLAGWISSHTGSLQSGLITGPVTLLLMTAMLPLLGVSQRESPRRSS